jgi:hypothetical protein
VVENVRDEMPLRLLLNIAEGKNVLNAKKKRATVGPLVGNLVLF